MAPRRGFGARRRAESALRGAAMRLGLDVQRAGPVSSVTALRRRLLAEHGIDLVVDGGAGSGQFGFELRRNGFRGRIVSFEPLPGPFAALRRRARPDRRWEVRRAALCDRAGEAEMNVAANSVSSSLLAVAPAHLAAAPASAPVATERVPAVTLDGVAAEIELPASRPYLKLDLQGAELLALAGAAESLESLCIIEAEVSLVETYHGGASLPELFSALARSGFACVGVFGGFVDRRRGRMLQVDAVFERAASKPASRDSSSPSP